MIGHIKQTLAACLFMLCLVNKAFAFCFSPSITSRRPLESPFSNKITVCLRTLGRHRANTFRMAQDDQEQPEKWAVKIQDENVERLESVKAGVLSAIAGSIAMAPVAIAARSQFYPSDAFSAQWELSHDSLAVMLALFGLVYRYAVRQGVVGAFAITRALAMLPVDSTCSPMPMTCGAPLGYLDWKMIFQGGGAGLESMVAFGAAAAAIERAFAQGWIRRFP